MASVTGGNKLQAFLKQIEANLQKASSVEVGFVNKETYPDGTPVAAVAMYNEFGTQNIPPRPFFRNAIKKNGSKWPKNLASLLKSHNYDSEIAFGLIGTKIQREIQDSIQSNTPPPNKKAVAEAKGFRKTLIDTGRMLQNVTHNVK